jgi:hypothetical protein
MGDPVARSGQAAGQQLPHPVGGHGQHPRLVCGREQAGRDRHRGDQFLLGGREAEPGQAVGEPGRGIESVLVVNRTVRPWARSHRTASGAPGTTWLPTYSVPSRSRSTVSMPVSRPTTHLRHVRLDHPGKASRCAAAASSTARTRKAGQRS